MPMSHHHDPTGMPDPFLRRMSLLIGLASRFADVFTDDDAAPAIKDLRDISRNEFAWTSADCDELLKAMQSLLRVTWTYRDVAARADGAAVKGYLGSGA